MKPHTLSAKIFLDSGDPAETKATRELLGFLDGQTTNPSLISKNPDTTGKKFAKGELLAFYKNVVREVSGLIPQGSVSIEVYADEHTTAEEMFSQGKDMFSWIPNAHIKFPTTKEGLKAARESIEAGMRVNMTLCFTQEQAAAVYAATRGAKRGDVFVSPFIGRLEDRGEKGMDVISNIIEMYRKGDGHVEVLTASVRSLHHVTHAVQLGSDIITAPQKILKEWAQQGMNTTVGAEAADGLEPIPYQELDLEQDWERFDIAHDLTDKGIERFAADWNKLLRGQP